MSPVRIRRKLHNDTPFEAVNVTPLIDVVMCLIIFFLIVGKLAHDTGNVRLPKSGTGKPESTADMVTVSVARPEGAGGAGAGGTLPRIFVDGTLATSETELLALIQRRAGIKPTGDGAYTPALLPVSIRCDRDLPFGAVEPVLAVCRALKIPGVRVATERAGPAGAGNAGGQP